MLLTSIRHAFQPPVARAAAIAVLVSVAAAARQAPDRDPRGRLVDTTTVIVPFADQLDPGPSNRVIRFVATHYAGAQKMIKAESDRYRAINPNWTLLHYRLGASSGPADYIHGDRWTSDWRDVTTHEDWFLHNERGMRHHDPVSNWDLHDPRNDGFRRYWVASVIADMRATGAQGVFADSFDAGISGYGITPPDARFEGTSPIDLARWPSGLTWDRQKLDFARYVTARFRAEPEQFLFVPNLAGLTTTWWGPHYDMIDGAMLEGFALGAAPLDWVLSMNRALELSRAEKLVIVQAYPKTTADRLFLVASYLLLKGRHTYVNAAGAGMVYFPEYLTDFGAAATPLPSNVDAYVWSGVYRRDFRNGVVLVNPSTRAVSVHLPQALSIAVVSGGGPLADRDIDAAGSYVGGRITYERVADLTLNPRTAALLVAK